MKRRSVVAAVALVIWASGTGTPAQDPSQNEANQEVSRKIEDLGADSADVRLDARQRLRAIGPSALPALKKAIYHQNPEIRVEAMSLARLIRSEAELQAWLAPVRRAVGKIRERWKARDFDDLEQVAFEAFGLLKPEFAHYVPKKEIGKNFRLAKREGETDLLTSALDEALNREPGIVSIGTDGSPRPLSNLFVFSLPDANGWSAYLVVGIGTRGGDASFDPARYRSVCLASTDSRQVWGIDPDEQKWVQAHLDLLIQQFQMSADPLGGLRIGELSPRSLPAARGLVSGDILKELNGTPVSQPGDLRTFLQGFSNEARTVLRITIERAGKPLFFDYRPLPR